MGTKLLLAVSCVVFAIGCGGNDGSNPPPPGGNPDSGPVNLSPTIKISSFAFNPVDLTVDAGTTIQVKNNDGTSHTVTSEAKDDDYSPGGVNGVAFDTGQITGGSSASFTIPTSAPSGTVIPFYCAVHNSMMGNGHITVH